MKQLVVEAMRAITKLKKYAKSDAAKELVQRLEDAALDWGEERVKDGTLAAKGLEWLRASLKVPEFDVAESE